jgi:hypothetical protein
MDPGRGFGTAMGRGRSVARALIWGVVWAGGSALATGCSSAPPDGTDGEFLPWPVGVFRVTTSVAFQNAEGSRQFTDRINFDGEITVGVLGPMQMSTPRGFCRDPEPTATQRDRDKDGWNFVCPDASVRIRPGSDDLIVRVSMRVTERYVVRGACEAYTTTSSGSRICTRYSTRIRTSQVTRNNTVRGRRIR